MKVIGKLKRIRDTVVAIETTVPIDYEENKDYVIDIKPKSKKRSLDQNAYLWQLITEIVKAENSGRCNEDMRITFYTKMLGEAGATSLFLQIDDKDFEKFKRSNMFRAYRVLGFNPQTNKIEILAYLGSSHFTTKEMSDFIDHVLDYASNLGIYTEYWENLLYGNN